MEKWTMYQRKPPKKTSNSLIWLVWYVTRCWLRFDDTSTSRSTTPPFSKLHWLAQGVLVNIVHQSCGIEIWRVSSHGNFTTCKTYLLCNDSTVTRRLIFYKACVIFNYKKKWIALLSYLSLSSGEMSACLHMSIYSVNRCRHISTENTSQVQTRKK